MMLRTPFVEKFDCAVSVSEGVAEFTFAITDDLFHGAGGLHGALYFFAMDNAAMLAANSYVTDVCVVTRDFTTHFLRPVSERLTGALLDRLTHHVNILEMNGDSYRLGQSRGRKDTAIN